MKSFKQFVLESSDQVVRLRKMGLAFVPMNVQSNDGTFDQDKEEEVATIWRSTNDGLVIKSVEGRVEEDRALLDIKLSNDDLIKIVVSYIESDPEDLAIMYIIKLDGTRKAIGLRTDLYNEWHDEFSDKFASSGSFIKAALDLYEKYR
jgi:hypothetical protein